MKKIQRVRGVELWDEPWPEDKQAFELKEYLTIRCKIL